MALLTNRDFYCHIAELLRNHAGYVGNLQAYLERLWNLSRRSQANPAVPLDEFAGWLTQAFEQTGPVVLELDQAQLLAHRDVATGFDAWENLILLQIIDLKRMQEKGFFANGQAYMGMQGHAIYWNNTSLFGFLECGAEGAFGGWQAGDDTGRGYVPGPVAYRAADGSIQSARPEELHTPIQVLNPIHWDEMVRFLEAGAGYE